MDRLERKEECLLISQVYNRYKDEDIVDFVTKDTCQFLLYWMDRQDRFKDIIFRPGENNGNLRQVWGSKIVDDIIQESKLECKRARHKKKTFDRCWELLLNDLRVIGNEVGKGE